ncbi:FkbM family methyltransferase [uncultured Erythrobacter sp.]|uniref:FkbM family methyltransferase n=1 Tax=uncultured Erythrobacter sp. TaxID=263913 RepID=UPI00262E6D14|nr:FkbM family methyltransferase [uncultured Erythrobacter sp.]
MLRHLPREWVLRFFRLRTKTTYLGRDRLLCRVLGNFKFLGLGTDLSLTPFMVADGYWEIWLSEYFARVIKRGDTVLDIGANLGYYSILAGALTGKNGQVFAVEPNPELSELIHHSANLNGMKGYVEVCNFAIAAPEDSGTRILFVQEGTKNGCFLEPGQSPNDIDLKGDAYDVPLGRFAVDQFERVDLIKIDVEGAELMVLENLRPIIEHFRPKIICEISFQRGYSYDEVMAALGRNGELRYLDFDGKVKGPLTRELAETTNVGIEWLICAE